MERSQAKGSRHHNFLPVRSGNGPAIRRMAKKKKKKWGGVGGVEFEDGQERGLPVAPGADGVPLSLCILVTSTGNWRGL